MLPTCAPEKPSLLIIWMRALVVFASLLLLTGGFLCDPAGGAKVGAQTQSPGITLNLIGQLLISLKPLGTALLKLVPSVVWMGMGVSLAAAYIIAAIVGSAVFHFRLRKVRIQSV
jgi:hypothetical protein